MVTVLIGGKGEDVMFLNVLKKVTFLYSDGRQCDGPDLPIGMADHFSTVVGSRIIACGGRTGDGYTLCFQLDMASNHPTWKRTSKFVIIIKTHKISLLIV